MEGCGLEPQVRLPSKALLRPGLGHSRGTVGAGGRLRSTGRRTRDRQGWRPFLLVGRGLRHFQAGSKLSGRVGSQPGRSVCGPSRLSPIVACPRPRARRSLRPTLPEASPHSPRPLPPRIRAPAALARRATSSVLAAVQETYAIIARPAGAQPRRCSPAAQCGACSAAPRRPHPPRVCSSRRASAPPGAAGSWRRLPLRTLYRALDSGVLTLIVIQSQTPARTPETPRTSLHLLLVFPVPGHWAYASTSVLSLPSLLAGQGLSAAQSFLSWPCVSPGARPSAQVWE